AMTEWIDFRTQSLTSLYQHLAEALRATPGVAPGSLQLAVCPRQSGFAQLAGYDYPKIVTSVDVIMPKLYFWHRGYDGTIGTAHRWVETLRSWNIGLSTRAAGQLTRLIFGPSVPVLDNAIDYDFILTPGHAAELPALEVDHA